MKYPANIREEALKNKVAFDFFSDYDTTNILGNIDFCVTPLINKKKSSQKQENLFGDVNLLWAEAKTGDYEVVAMFAQLLLTIGKARTFDKCLPPAFLGAFDAKKIAFVPYNAVMDIFSLNDFNWNVTSSNRNTKEFALIKDRIEKSLEKNQYIFDYLFDEQELKYFIKNNLAKATQSGKIAIDKNNFVPIYLRWIEQVKPYIDFNWAEGKKQNILDNSFYLADLFVDDKDTPETDDDTPISDNLFVVFRNGHYEIAKANLKSLFDATIKINNKTAYEQFWKKYKRPPIAEFQQYILQRKDLLVPQDIRERKGAFFTPQKWVELSQKYLTDALGNNWQDEYYVWDCAAGTGNLLAGLTNPFHIYASTLDQSDVNVMHERIENGATLLNEHIFQFDFLNDEFLPQSKGGKLPENLYKIIINPEKRKKLIVYINPPYAEATSAKTVTGTGENKDGITTQFKINEYFKPKIGNASNEIFALFMANIYEKMNGCMLGQFSTLKFVNGSNFSKFKEFFKADFLNGFVVPAQTFDNVKGSFPIGFTLWNTQSENKITEITCDVYDKDANYKGTKGFYGNLPQSINKWIVKYQSNKENYIGTLFYRGNDFQNQKYIYLNLGSTKAHDSELYICSENLIPSCIYLSVRQCIEATWLNDRDQFLYPNEGWQTDTEFQNDCLAYTLFHSQNKISAKHSLENSSPLGRLGGDNHWIPFTEAEVKAKTTFESNFMTNFIAGKTSPNISTNDTYNTQQKTLFEEVITKNNTLQSIGARTFSPEAQAVFAAGKELYKYYHTQSFPSFGGVPEGRGGFVINASLYDIKEYFQGRNEKGKMNSKSPDETYNLHIKALRESLKILAQKIEPKVYDYGFLKR